MNFKDLIIYEDSDVFVINKPSGLMVHADGKSKDKSLTDLILEAYPDMVNVGEPWKLEAESLKLKEDETTLSKEAENSPLPTTSYQLKTSFIPRPGIVHRLDRETSGVMIIARTQKSFEFLKQQFQNRTIQKKYLAYVWGSVKEDKGTVDKPIGRSTSDFRMYSAQRGARGLLREALTDYKTLLRFEKDGEKFSLIEAYPKTGRTHQIRVHMKYLNHPIMCDRLYARNKPCLLGFDRLALHAKAITFKTPEGKILTIEAPTPEEFLRPYQENVA